MVEPKNGFDCVALKNEIQSRMLHEFEGMSDEEQRLTVKQELATSENAVARKWRACRNEEKVSSFR